MATENSALLILLYFDQINVDLVIIRDFFQDQPPNFWIVMSLTKTNHNLLQIKAMDTIVKLW